MLSTGTTTRFFVYAILMTVLSVFVVNAALSTEHARGKVCKLLTRMMQSLEKKPSAFLSEKRMSELFGKRGSLSKQRTFFGSANRYYPPAIVWDTDEGGTGVGAYYRHYPIVGKRMSELFGKRRGYDGPQWVGK